MDKAVVPDEDNVLGEGNAWWIWRSVHLEALLQVTAGEMCATSAPMGMLERNVGRAVDVVLAEKIAVTVTKMVTVAKAELADRTP